MSDMLEPSDMERADLPDTSRQYMEDLETENDRLRNALREITPW